VAFARAKRLQAEEAVNRLQNLLAISEEGRAGGTRQYRKFRVGDARHEFPGDVQAEPGYVPPVKDQRRSLHERKQARDVEVFVSADERLERLRSDALAYKAGELPRGLTL